MHGVHGKVQEGDRGTGRCRRPGQSAITVHGHSARVHGKVQDRGRAGAWGRCTGAREGAERDDGARACTGRCRGPGQRAITVHGDGARVHGKVQGTERDNGARGRCTD